MLEHRVRQFLDAKRIKHESKRMMGGLCFMVKGNMCVGVEQNQLTARIGPDAYEDALTRKGCRPMDFTGRPRRGFVFVGREGLKSEKREEVRKTERIVDDLQNALLRVVRERLFQPRFRFG